MGSLEVVFYGDDGNGGDSGDDVGRDGDDGGRDGNDGFGGDVGDELDSCLVFHSPGN